MTIFVFLFNRGISALLIYGRRILRAIITYSYLVTIAVVFRVYLCIAQLCMNQWISINANIAGIRLIPFLIIAIIQSGTVGAFANYRLFVCTIITVRSSLTILVILLLTNRIPCIVPKHKIPLSIIVTVLDQPVVLVYHIAICKASFFPQSRLTVNSAIT